MKLKNKDLAVMSPDDLAVNVDDLRRELFQLELKAATAHMSSFPSKRRELRKAIARSLTHWRSAMIMRSLEYLRLMMIPR